MNLDEIFEAIFKATDYPAEKKEKFILTFYKYLIVKVLLAVKEEDQALFNDLNNSIVDTEKSVQRAKAALESLSKNSSVKKKVDEVVDQVLTELIDDIVGSATGEQKRKILESLPN